MPLVLGPLDREHSASNPLIVTRRWRQSAALQAHVRHPGMVTLEQQARWFTHCASDSATRMWMIYASRDDRPCPYFPNCAHGHPFVGVAGLCHIDWRHRSAELSWYVMRPDDTEAFEQEPEVIGLLACEAFEVLGLHRVWAECLTPERIAVCRAAGMTAEGTLRDISYRDGRWVSGERFSLLETEWLLRD